MKAQTFTELLKSSESVQVIGQENPIEKTENSQTFNIMKTDDDKRLIFGWASVAIKVDGEQVVDHQKDMIDPDDLEEAVYKYVLNFRDGGEEHIANLRKKARMVESCMFTKEKMKAMGIPEGIVPEGWWIGFYVDDDDAWEKVKNGVYQMFSIEGQGVREEIEDDIEKSERVNGCGVLVVKDGKILTGTRIDGKHKNQICGPGGHIESGEEPEDAAIRETIEEFGIECKNLKPLGILDGGRNYGKSAIFLCTEYEGEPETDEEEMTDIKWRTIEDLRAEKLFHPFEQSLELVEEYITKSVRIFDLKEFPEFGMWHEENLEASEEEVKAAKEYYDELKRKKPLAKTFDEILKFNPFHDALGRFASSSGFKTYSANPKTKAGQLAIGRSDAAGHGATMNVHRESKGENIRQNQHWISTGQKPAVPAAQAPKKNYDKLGFADHDDADYHSLHSGKKYYQQQNLTAAQQKAAQNYLEDRPEPGSLYSHSQNMNYMMANGQTLTGKYKQTHDGLMSSMHNLGYNVELTRYDHDAMIDGLLQATGAGSSHRGMSIGQIKKALVGATMNEDKFLSVSYNDFGNAPQSSKQVFTTRMVKITYRAKASTQAMMPGNGPGGSLGELILAPTNGTSNPGGKIVDVKYSGNKARRKGTQILNQKQIEIVVEI